MKHCNSYVFEVLVALEQFEFALLVVVKIFDQFCKVKPNASQKDIKLPTRSAHKTPERLIQIDNFIYY